MHEVIHDDHRQMIHHLCSIMGLSYGKCQLILLDELNMRQTAAKFVPRSNIGQKSAWNTRSRSEQTQTCFPSL